MIWGGALLPGGTFVTWSGVAVSAAVIVRGVGFLTIVRPILFPTMRTQGLTVGFLIWLVLAGVIHGGNAIGLTPPLAAWVLRPLWVVPADRYLEAPYNADQSRVVFVGPYFLYDASVGPGGIRGHVFGGGSIRIAWDSVNGYRMVSASAMH